MLVQEKPNHSDTLSRDTRIFSEKLAAYTRRQGETLPLSSGDKRKPVQMEARQETGAGPNLAPRLRVTASPSMHQPDIAPLRDETDSIATLVDGIAPTIGDDDQGEGNAKENHQPDTICSQLERLTAEIARLRHARLHSREQESASKDGLLVLAAHDHTHNALIPFVIHDNSMNDVLAADETAGPLIELVPVPAQAVEAVVCAPQEEQARSSNRRPPRPPLPRRKPAVRAEPEQAIEAPHALKYTRGRSRKTQKPGWTASVNRSATGSAESRLSGSSGRIRSALLLGAAALVATVAIGEGVRRSLTSQPDQTVIASASPAGLPPSSAGVQDNRPAAIPAPVQAAAHTAAMADSQPTAASGAALAPVGKGLSLDMAVAAGDPRALFDKAVSLSASRDAAALAQASQLFQRAADRNFVPAMFRLGLAYEKGLGVTADKARAASLYEQAARAGNIKAMHNLATLSINAGAGGQPDYFRAAQWFRSAADHGLADSQFNYAVLAAKGRGVPQSAAVAFRYFALAARQGDAEAAVQREEVARWIKPDERAAIESDVRTFVPRKAAADANEKTLPSSPWHNKGFVSTAVAGS